MLAQKKSLPHCHKAYRGLLNNPAGSSFSNLMLLISRLGASPTATFRGEPQSPRQLAGARFISCSAADKMLVIAQAARRIQRLMLQAAPTK